MSDLPYTLTPYQEYSIREINSRFKANINPVCALPTGEGKTVIACSLIKALIEKGETGFLIIARANNLNDPWINELKKFSIPYSLIHGNERKDLRLNNRYPARKGSVLLTSHDTTVLDIDYFENTGPISLLIIDEAHIGNNSKKLTNFTVQFSRLRAKRKLFLTATPMQNAQYELGLLYILLNNPGEIGDREPQSAINKRILELNYNEAVKNQILITADTQNRQSADPERLDITVSKVILAVPLTEDMEDYIENNQFHFFYTDESESLFPKTRLFKFLSHPDSIYTNNTTVENIPKCGKIDAVLSIIKNTPKNDKIIIFSQYKDVLYRYFLLLKAKGYSTVIITGEDRTEQHEKLRLFKETDIYRILLTTLFKSAEGLNLKEANHVIILEFWWNPQKIIQAMGRVTRKNQEKNVFIYMLCYNEGGQIYQYEIPFLETMKRKIAEAKETMPTQAELPNIEIFGNKNTYKEELELFLKSFLFTGQTRKPTSRAITGKKKIKVIYKTKTRSGKPEQIENSSAKAEDPATQNLLNDLMKIQLQKISGNYNKKFDDIDLTGPSSEKPR